MTVASIKSGNVEQVVPFFGVIMPPSCFRRSCRNANRRKRLVPDNRYVSCATMRWHCVANLNHAAYSRRIAN
jgi:hypothetical protein